MTTVGSAGGGHPVRAELDAARARLAAAGVASPRTDAELLLAHVLGVDRGLLAVRDDIDTATADRFHDLVARRGRRVPLQHLVGSADFGPVRLAVGPGVFVPRPETEWLAEWATHVAAGHQTPLIADLCSGSGALALAVATLVPTARVTAVELSDDALVWLRRNVTAAPAGVRARVAVRRGDVRDPSQLAAVLGVAPDVIVVNPPYVPVETIVSAEVDADPAEAVFAGGDGMAVITPLIAALPIVARRGTAVGIEHDETTGDAVRTALGDSGDYVDIVGHSDLTGRQRFVTARIAR